MTAWKVYWQNFNFGKCDVNDSIADWDLKNGNTLFRHLDKKYGMEDNSQIDLIGIILN